MRKLLALLGFIPAAAFIPSPADAAESIDCDVTHIEIRLFTDPVSPFMPPTPLEEPEITLIQECEVAERVPLISGGTTVVRTDVIVEVIVDGDHLVEITDAVAELVGHDDAVQ